MQHPVRIVPDLSLIDYNDSSDLKYDRHTVKSALQTKSNQRVDAERSSVNPVHKEDTDSYIAWRTKNAHLFNKSASSLNQTSNTYQAKNSINNKRMNNNEHSTLLKKITEISERLEREDISEETNLQSNQRCDNGSATPFINCTDQDMKFCKNDDSYGRVKELYDRIFPSEKLKSHVSYDNGFPVDENRILNSEQNFERSDNRNFADENVNRSLMREISCAPKKKVTYECDGMTRLSSSDKYSGDCESTASRYNQDSCLSNPSNNQEGVFHDSLMNQSSIRRKPSHPNYDYKHKSCNSNSPMERSVIVYDYDSPKYNFEKRKSSEHRSVKKFYDARISENDRNNVCLCPHCPKNGKSKDSIKRYRDKHCDYYHKKALSESNSSCDDVPINEHCCYETFKKKKKKITVDELYKIVKLQNEQINLLQKQIDRLLEQNYNFKKMFESYQITQQKIPPKNELLQGSVNNNCSCQNNNSDKFTSQGFTFSVVQENSKIEQQNYDGTNSNIKKCTNVSIGVMTSFVELTQKIHGIAPQSNASVDMNKKNECLQGSINDSENRKDLCPQRWKKSTDSPAARFGRESSCAAVAEESFTLNEVDLPALPVLVNEHIPTPQSSVHVDIQDYGSTTTSSSGSTDSESDQYSENEGKGENLSEDERVGWTLYDNVVGQVNKILQRSEPRNETKNSAVPEIDDVRNATIQQLRRLGVSFIDNDSSAVKKVTFNPVFNGSSKNVAARANRFHHNGTDVIDTNGKTTENPLQYLNEEEILQAAINIMNKKKESPNVDVFPPNDTSPVYDNNDVSFATMKYLERYRLIPSGSNNEERTTQNRPVAATKKQKRHKVSQQQPLNQQQQLQLQYNQQRIQQLQYNEQRPQNLLSNKILDITALKQQPKLL